MSIRLSHANQDRYRWANNQVCVSVTDKLSQTRWRTYDHARTDGYFVDMGKLNCVRAYVFHLVRWTCDAHSIGSHRDYQGCDARSSAVYAWPVRFTWALAAYVWKCDCEGAFVHFGAGVSEEHRHACAFVGGSVRRGAAWCCASKWNRRQDGNSRRRAVDGGRVNCYKTDHKYLGIALYICATTFVRMGSTTACSDRFRILPDVRWESIA